MKTNFFTIIVFALIASVSFNDTKAQTITTLASGFNSPIGITRDLKGNLWINEPGTGNNDSRVSLVKTSGKVFTAITGLPSFKDTAVGETDGTWRSYFLPDGRVLVVSGGGNDVNAASLLYFDFKGWTPGVDSPKTVADARSVIHIGEFLIKNGFTDTNPFDVAWDSAGNIFVSDAAANAVLKVDQNDSISVVAVFDPIPNNYTPFPPFIDPVPTVIKWNPAGGFYLSYLTGFPFVPGIASVVNLNENGDTSTYASNLTQVVDMQVDSITGKVYVLQFGLYDTSFNPIPGSAQIIRIDSGGNHTIVQGFGPSAGMVTDGEGGFYVTSLITGEILHIADIATGVSSVNSTSRFNIIASPNPFSEVTTIQFNITNTSDVKFSVVNIMGEEVFSQNKGSYTAGSHNFLWNGKGTGERSLTPGMYFIKLITNEGIQTSGIIKN
ncbi:MAG: ScyD/ScyE family protein [Chitinophagales bacterium]|nr:ScyD/ScyE family protein [Chitinophagales bacterium]